MSRRTRAAERAPGPLRAALVVALLALLTAWWAERWQEARNRQVEHAAIEELAHLTVKDIKARFMRYDAGLRGLRGAVMAAGERDIRLEQVQAYIRSRNFEQEFPGARGFGVVWRVSAAEEARFVARARQDGRPNYEVHQFTPQAGERKLVAFAEPFERNEAGLGLDLASDPARDTAAIFAARSGESTLSLPVELRVAPSSTRNGLMLALPIYRNHAAMGTPEERESAAMGWTYAALVIDDVLKGLQGQGHLYDLTLDDLPDGGSGTPVRFFGASLSSASAEATALDATVEFDMRGRRWQAHFIGTPVFVESLNLSSPRAVALITGGTGLLLALLVFTWASAGVQARRERLEVARRAAIVEGSDDAIIGATLDGVVTEWNGGAERLFGYTSDEALGARVEDLLLPADCLPDEIQFRATIASGHRVPPFDTLRRHKDGTLIAVSLTAGPILDARGQCVGMAKTLRDTREAQRAKAELAALNASLEEQVASRTAALVAALRDNTALLQTLDRFAIVGVADREGRLLEVNERYCRLSGFESSELVGESLLRLAHEQHDEEFWAAMWSQVRAGQVWRGEICNHAKDGQTFWTDSIIAPVVDADSVVERLICISTDISPIMRLQQEADRARVATEEANRFLQEVTDRLPLRIAYLDLEHRFRFVNAAQCEAYGLPRAELLGRLPQLFVNHEPPPALRPHFEAVLQGVAQTFEAAIPLPRGGLADYEVRLVPDQRGNEIVGYYTVATDISVRKRGEEELQRALGTLRAVLDAATQVSILATDTAGRVRLFNRGAEKLTGYLAEEVIGQRTVPLLHDPQELAQRTAALQAEWGEPVDMHRTFIDPRVIGEPRDWLYVRKDGSRVPVSLAVTPILDERGAAVGYLGIAYDIQTRLQFEHSLREAMDRANQANRAKSEFLANMSHEIRTPMNAVIGLSYLLERTALDPDQSSFVSKIKLASKSLLGIINDVLDLSKIEAAEMQIECAPFSLASLLDELGELMAIQAEAKGIGFSVQRPDALVEAFEGDATRIRQVLTNLLSNAIKFTSQGEVRLIVEQAPQPSDDAPVPLRFRVQDTGIGIAADALERVFQPFAQADTSTTRRYGGTGLGLSIVRQLVTLMGGQVEVRSEPGAGSEFTVALALPPSHGWSVSEDKLVHLGAGQSLAGLRILVVDDSELNLEVARRILELEGATVTLAENGQEAIDCLLNSPGSHDLVLMDMQMPVLDGHDATRRIRSGLGLTQLPIVALTAGVTVGEKQRAAAAGMNDLLGKPFEPEDLVGCILRHVGRVQARPAAGRAALGPAWPALPGIDMADAQRRLSGDLTLFRSLLHRMLEDFADLETLPAPAAEGLPELARRMHKLKGTAGTLGVRDIEQAAAAAERASLAAYLQEVTGGLTQLAEHLSRLRQATADFLNEPQETAVDASDALPLDTDAVKALCQLLRSSDLAALQALEPLRPALRQRLAPADYDRLQRQMDGLDFRAAEQLLSPLA